jgi:hypothetical protein
MLYATISTHCATRLDLAAVPPELEPYKQHIVRLCDMMQALADRNIVFLGLGDDDILEDVLSDTQQVARYVRLLSTRLAIPILRAASADRLCLTLIGWLHDAHLSTVVYPPVTSDGSPAIWPFTSLTPMYFFPCIEQRGLLYLPLLFHEFGHLLYACHRQEMDDLVEELRRAIGNALVPPSQRNDRHAQNQTARRQAIVDTWYSWAQEFFCDAVGLTIGGPSYIHAFSSYLSSMDRAEFYRGPEELQKSAHPVTWLRIQFLAERAIAAGYSAVAQRMTDDWQVVAQTLGVVEDYHGFYTPAVADHLSRTIDDMLEEAAPRQCTDDEAHGQSWSVRTDSMIRLLNWAWQVYETQPNAYDAWEAAQIRLLLA